mmetsp:Transcript_2712/g.2269  ORF Transcript_2712/g.2269 Transcript_2712/m.2269 type:complete len:120 (-) Transcript_2712:30-389(-)
MFNTLIQKLQQVNVIEFRSEEYLQINDIFLDFLRINTKLRDLELKVHTCDDFEQVLQSLKSNYMLKTLVLDCDEAISMSISKQIKEFEQERICVEVIIKYRRRIAYPKVNLPFDIFYPE